MPPIEKRWIAWSLSLLAMTMEMQMDKSQKPAGIAKGGCLCGGI
jgi:hypothetical protein